MFITFISFLEGYNETSTEDKELCLRQKPLVCVYDLRVSAGAAEPQKTFSCCLSI